MDENQHEGEEDFIFNEYSIDDTLDPLNRLIKYHTSDFSLQRLVLIRELTDTAVFAGYSETVRSLLPLLSAFVSDSEPAVRQMFVQQLHPLAEYVINSGGEAGYQHLLNTFLPFAFELLVDKNVEVGNSALASLNKMAQLVRPQHVEPHLLHVVITLAHDERAEDYRVVAAQLFDDLAAKFGDQLCISMVINEVKLLANDMSFSVRKTVGANLGNLCKVVGPAIAAERIMPIYLNLCKDEIWGVRRACAENIVHISENVAPEVRVQALIPTFKALSEDASRWVRVAAYQTLGYFIHTMRREDISPMFLKLFTDMAFQSEGGDSDFAEYCAFSFPAVAQVIGKERWREIDDAFSTLLKDVQWKVRKSLAYSLHELAQIVGTDITERSLVTAFELFLRDLDEVKLGVLQNADAFIAVLSPAQRERFIPMICNVPADSENWRLRNLVASKLGHLAKLVSPEVCSASIADMTYKLLDDSVTEVRSSTFHSAALLLVHLYPSPPHYQDFLNKISQLITRGSFQQRQMFAYICQQIIELNAVEVFNNDFCSKFCSLATDRVANVRYVVARVLATSVVNNTNWNGHAELGRIVRELRNDPEADIAALAAAQLPRPEKPENAAMYR